MRTIEEAKKIVLDKYPDAFCQHTIMVTSINGSHEEWLIMTTIEGRLIPIGPSSVYSNDAAWHYAAQRIQPDSV